MYPSTTIVIGGGGGSSIFLARTGASIELTVFVGCLVLLVGLAFMLRSRALGAAGGRSRGRGRRNSPHVTGRR